MNTFLKILIMVINLIFYNNFSECFRKHFPLLFDFILNFDKIFSEKLKEFLKIESYKAEYHKVVGFSKEKYFLFFNA